MRKQQPAAVSWSPLGVLSLCIVTRLSHILEKTTQRASRNLGRERKESVEEEAEAEEVQEVQEGEIDAATILHAATALETPSSDKTGRPVWLPSSVARHRTRTTGCLPPTPPDPLFKQILTHPPKAWASKRSRPPS